MEDALFHLTAYALSVIFAHFAHFFAHCTLLTFCSSLPPPFLPSPHCLTLTLIQIPHPLTVSGSHTLISHISISWPSLLSHKTAFLTEDGWDWGLKKRALLPSLCSIPRQPPLWQRPWQLAGEGRKEEEERGQAWRGEERKRHLSIPPSLSLSVCVDIVTLLLLLLVVIDHCPCSAYLHAWHLNMNPNLI